MKLSEHKINSYLTEVTIDDHKIFLTDLNKKEKVRNNLFSSSDILKFIGCLIGFVSFLMIVGIVGHGDYIVEMNLSDDWAIKDYIMHTVIALSGFSVAYILCTIGRYPNRFAKNM